MAECRHGIEYWEGRHERNLPILMGSVYIMRPVFGRPINCAAIRRAGSTITND